MSEYLRQLVRIVGLSARPDLNGKEGLCTAFENDRYSVAVNRDLILRVKRENLELLSAAATSAVPDKEKSAGASFPHALPPASVGVGGGIPLPAHAAPSATAGAGSSSAVPIPRCATTGLVLFAFTSALDRPSCLSSFFQIVSFVLFVSHSPALMFRHTRSVLLVRQCETHAAR
jgi:hypothetical protein